MASHDRPSGLTALAVLHLIFGCLDALGGIGLLIVYFAPGQGHDPETVALKELSLRAFLVFVGAHGLATIALLASGVGCLLQIRWLGLWVGNAFVALGLFSVVYMHRALPVQSAAHHLDLIRQLFYPVFTAYLLNRVFRRDFTR